MPKRGRSPKIETSIHEKFILDCIQKDLNGSEISRLLQERGVTISIPTINNYIKKVKKTGINLSQFKKETENTAIEVNNKINSIKELSGIFNRRNNLIETLLDRRKKLLEFSEEGPRTEILLQKFFFIKDLIEKNKKNIPLEDFNQLNLTWQFLQTFIKGNFKDTRPYPQIEDLIRKYTLDIHEICKYVEQWTSKYEIEALMEKLCEGLTKAAVNTFGPLLKRETENYRMEYIQKFIKEVELVMQELRDYQLNLGEKQKGKMKSM